MLHPFNQYQFLDSNVLESVLLAKQGYVFIPDACLEADRETKCNLHVSMHGCDGGIEGGEEWIRNTGYTHYAASNDLVILFPTANFCHDVYNDDSIELIRD